MPRMDGTGPMGQGAMGQGAMTGRGQGNCQENGNAKRLGVGYGKGVGCGRGNGMGCSYGVNNARRMSYGKGFGFRADVQNSNIAPLHQDELSLLKSQANMLEGTLNNVKSRISNFEEK